MIITEEIDIMELCKNIFKMIKRLVLSGNAVSIEKVYTVHCCTIKHNFKHWRDPVPDWLINARKSYFVVPGLSLKKYLIKPFQLMFQLNILCWLHETLNCLISFNKRYSILLKWTDKNKIMAFLIWNKLNQKRIITSK